MSYEIHVLPPTNLPSESPDSNPKLKFMRSEVQLFASPLDRHVSAYTFQSDGDAVLKRDIFLVASPFNW